jgi:prepilin-type N-terminal cleavage/methylation domain-containing protein
VKSERGFTLIELLVVIAILAVLFGVTALALTNVGSNAKTEVMQAEKDVVQTAIDVYMTVSNSTSITAGGPEEVGPATSGFGAYLRRSSEYLYTWDSSGEITGQAE